MQLQQKSAQLQQHAYTTFSPLLKFQAPWDLSQQAWRNCGVWLAALMWSKALSSMAC
jgi:hypothetical protein